jgi:hypothetical protein
MLRRGGSDGAARRPMAPWRRNLDQARTDFALLESNLEFIASRLSRLPTRRDLAMAALGIIVSTAALVILWAEAFWPL